MTLTLEAGPIDDSTDRAVADRQLFDRIARKYARKDFTESTSLAREYQLLHAVAPVLEQIGTDGTILDVGCGVGAAAKYLANRCERYIGIDHSAEMIRLANQLSTNDVATEFVAADVTEVEWQHERVDLVLAIGALHHMTDVGAVLRSLRRVAKPNAWLVAIEPQSGNPLISLARSVRKRIDKGYSEDQHFFSAAELRCLCEQSGLVDVTLEHQGFCSKPFGQVILPFEPAACLLSKAAVAIDRVLDCHLPRRLRSWSWDLIVRARFPDDDAGEDSQ